MGVQRVWHDLAIEQQQYPRQVSCVSSLTYETTICHSGVVCSLLSFPIWGQCQISPRNLLKLQVNVNTQKIVSFTDVLCNAILELCQTHTRCFVHAYLILQCVSKIILAYSLAYTRCFMKVSFLFLCVGVLYLSSVSYILGANACLLSLSYE